MAYGTVGVAANADSVSDGSGSDGELASAVDVGGDTCPARAARRRFSAAISIATVVWHAQAHALRGGNSS